MNAELFSAADFVRPILVFVIGAIIVAGLGLLASLLWEGFLAKLHRHLSKRTPTKRATRKKPGSGRIKAPLPQYDGKTD